MRMTACARDEHPDDHRLDSIASCRLTPSRAARDLHPTCDAQRAGRLQGAPMLKDLLPHKRVAAELGVSRSSLWRAMKSGIAGFPTPVVLRRRLYWREADLPALKEALDRFAGRNAFETARRHARARVARAEALGKKNAARRSRAPPRQPDLFDDDDGDVGAPRSAGATGRSPDPSSA
jgi:predicted DNA-binding transcriptional regulator AlpA